MLSVFDVFLRLGNFKRDHEVIRVCFYVTPFLIELKVDLAHKLVLVLKPTVEKPGFIKVHEEAAVDDEEQIRNEESHPDANVEPTVHVPRLRAVSTV